MKRTLSSIRENLLQLHGPLDAVSRDPFILILWQQVGYLANDAKRMKALQKLETEVGLTPEAIAAASLPRLEEIARSGGAIAFKERASRMQQSARRVISEWGGDLKRALQLPAAKAIRALTKFPMIGKPGAEKILLFSGAQPVLALESNGLRVLLRLGYGQEEASYDKSYRSVRQATLPEATGDSEWLTSLHLLLQRHGQTLCRQKSPDCDVCPLLDGCPFGSNIWGGEEE